jgi:SAM-dependent methyltransferase
MALNPYDDENVVRASIASRGHRDTIGGLWDQLGQLQLTFLQQSGLAPHHTFLDVGCGSLRAGVLLAKYLEAGRYHGIDISPSLLEEGRRELETAGVSARVPAANLRATADFDASGFPPFDYAIAQSVFTHLPIDVFALALKRLRPCFALSGRFYVTFFTAERDQVERVHETAAPGGVVTYLNADPYHYAVEAIHNVAEATNWRMNWIGEWGHPRDQQIAAFTLA